MVWLYYWRAYHLTRDQYRFLEWLLPLLVQVLVAGPSIILPFSLGARHPRHLNARVSALLLLK